MRISTLDERIKREGTWAYQQTCAAVERTEDFSDCLAKLERAAADAAPNARFEVESARAKVDWAIRYLREARDLIHSANVDAFLVLCNVGRDAE